MAMEAIIRAATDSTPQVHGDPETGIVAMAGDSYPENSFEFFVPLLDWIKLFLAEKAFPLQLHLRLVYMNTSSVKALMDIFDLLEAAHQNGQAASVTWFCDPRNDRVVEMVEEFREDCTFPFELVSEPGDD